MIYFIIEIEIGFFFLLQHVLGVSGEELVGTLTNMVTFTRGEQIKRHYTKAMAEGKICFFLSL